MPTKAKVAFSEIIENSGLSGIKILDILKIPYCESINFQNQNPETDVEFTIYSDDSKKKYISRGKIINIIPVFPVTSYLEASGKHTLVFRYKDHPDQQKLVFTDRISIPMPPGWPQPNFLNPKYPIAV